MREGFLAFATLLADRKATRCSIHGYDDRFVAVTIAVVDCYFFALKQILLDTAHRDTAVSFVDKRFVNAYFVNFSIARRAVCFAGVENG